MQNKGFKVNKGLVKKIGSVVLAGAIAVGSYMIGHKNGTMVGYEKGTMIGYEDGTNDATNSILNGENEKLIRIQELKNELTSDLVSIMKARYQLLEEETKNNYKLSDIYVLDTDNDEYKTLGQASHYSYRYVFLTSRTVPTIGSTCDILFADEDLVFQTSFYYNGPTVNSSYVCVGDYSFDGQGSFGDAMPHVEPLVYYLTDDEIQSSYTYEQLQMLFYRINSDELIQGQVLQNVK